MKKAKAELDKNLYEVQQAEVDPVKVEQEDGGRPIVLRQFHFKFTKDQLKYGTMTEEKLAKSVNFNTDSKGTQQEKLKLITNSLWLDELELIEVPRVSLTADGKCFNVFATAQAKKGSTYSWRGKPNLIQDVI